MDLLTLLTVIGGVVLTIGYLPQIIKLHKTYNTAGINIAFWYLIAGAVLITAINLVIDSAPLVLIIIQSANALLAFYLVYLVTDLRGKPAFGIILALVLIVLFVSAVPLSITQGAATVMIVIAYASQLVTLFKADSVEGVSPSLYLVIAIGLAIMALKMFVTEVTAHIIATELVNITLLLLCAAVSSYHLYVRGGKEVESETI